jgi:hypothetical protein
MYGDTRRGNKLNNKYTVSQNKIFEGVLNKEFAGLVHFVNTFPFYAIRSRHRSTIRHTP